MPAKRNRQLPAASMHLVLALLEGENHGYGLLRQVEELSDGAVRMGPGTLYGTLNRLVGDGLIIETTDHAADDKARRRYYRLTAQGEQVAKAEYARLRTLVARVGMLRPDLGRAAT